LFPVSLLIVTPDGIFEYLPRKHALWQRQSGDHRQALQEAALDQPFVGRAAAIFVLVIDVGVSAAKYSRLAERYCLIEVGHAAQNILLEATSLELGCVPVGLLDDERVRTVLGLGRNLEPVYLLPLGHPASKPVD
jgi:SagB-type dehydrogenase family enzyme